MTVADWTKGDLERFVSDHLARPETRRTIDRPVPVPTAPTFATGWANLGGGNQSAGYYMDRNRVYLSGVVANGGTGTGLIFTLPVNFRPSATRAFSTAILAGNGTLTIDSSGQVTDSTFSAASKALLSLDGISFEVV